MDWALFCTKQVFLSAVTKACNDNNPDIKPWRLPEAAKLHNVAPHQKKVGSHCSRACREGNSLEQVKWHDMPIVWSFLYHTFSFISYLLWQQHLLFYICKGLKVSTQKRVPFLQHTQTQKVSVCCFTYVQATQFMQKCAYRIHKIHVQTIAKFSDSKRDLVKMHILLTSIYEHKQIFSCKWLVSNLDKIFNLNILTICTPEFLALVPSHIFCGFWSISSLRGKIISYPSLNVYIKINFLKAIIKLCIYACAKFCIYACGT